MGAKARYNYGETIKKVDAQIEKRRAELKSISGEYLVNTAKRLLEERDRESKRQRIRLDIGILRYLKEKASEENMTALEYGMITGTTRESLESMYIKKYKNHMEIKYPEKNPTKGENDWWNKEQDKEQKRLKKAGIDNIEQLHDAVEKYKIIRELVEDPEEGKKSQIKMLEAKYRVLQRGDINFTPAKVVKEMIRLAGIDHNSYVLEPSAGIGNIADQLKEITENVDVIEISPEFKELLRMKGHNTVGDDFLQYCKAQYYDAIIMNPPFCNNQDIKHLQHAYDLLKNNGRLVCITSVHWSFASDKASQQFREWIGEKNHELVQLDAGTFEATNVQSQIVVISKNEEAARKAV